MVSRILLSKRSTISKYMLRKYAWHIKIDIQIDRVHVTIFVPRQCNLESHVPSPWTMCLLLTVWQWTVIICSLLLLLLTWGIESLYAVIPGVEHPLKVKKLKLQTVALRGAESNQYILESPLIYLILYAWIYYDIGHCIHLKLASSISLAKFSPTANSRPQKTW